MLILILAVIALLMWFFIYYNKLKEFIYIAKRLNVLPKKKGYPLIGHVLEFFGSPEFTFRQVTLYIKETARNGLTVVWMLFLPLILVTEPTVVERVLRNSVNNEKGLIYKVILPWLNEGLLTSGGEKWRSRRKLLSQGFHFNFLQKCLPVFNEKGRNLIDALKDHCHNEVDVYSVLSYFTLDIIFDTTMGTSLGGEQEEGEKYRSSIHNFGILAAQRIVKTWLMFDFIHRFSENYLKQLKILDILHRFTERAISVRKYLLRKNAETNCPEEITSGSDREKKVFLDSLISAQMRGDNIDDRGIREEVDTFVFAGHDTTSISLSFTLMLLANNKKCQDKLYDELLAVLGNDDRDPTNADLQELKYLECCIKESLRLYPSVPKIGRMLGEDILLDNGVVLPKNCSVVIMIYEMHRRAELYPNPDTFDPDRFTIENSQNRHPFAYLPFSHGPRNCIGQKFAMMEMKCLLAAIVRNYILEPVDTPETLQFILDIVLRSKTPVRVKFIPRK